RCAPTWWLSRWGWTWASSSEPAATATSTTTTWSRTAPGSPASTSPPRSCGAGRRPPSSTTASATSGSGDTKPTEGPQTRGRAVGQDGPEGVGAGPRRCDRLRPPHALLHPGGSGVLQAGLRRTPRGDGSGHLGVAPRAVPAPAGPPQHRLHARYRVGGRGG